MKTAIIYYSLEGNCGFVAETLKEELGADIFRLELAEEKGRTGFAKYFWGGSMVIMKKKPALKPLDFSPDKYDRIIIGTPVWAASPAPALCAFLDKNRFTGKTIALFCCHAGGKGAVFDKMKALLPDNTFAAEIDFVNPLKADKEEIRSKVLQWAKTLG
ncbi:flavodoxin [Spirochaetia bacterium]|nr:flavodoxin [Spirochaetia bacterium]